MLDLCKLCANVEPEIPPPITRQSYCASEEDADVAWRRDEVVVLAVVDTIEAGGANASVFFGDNKLLPTISSTLDLTIVYLFVEIVVGVEIHSNSLVWVSFLLNWMDGKWKVRVWTVDLQLVPHLSYLLARSSS